MLERGFEDDRELNYIRLLEYTPSLKHAFEIEKAFKGDISDESTDTWFVLFCCGEDLRGRPALQGSPMAIHTLLVDESAIYDEIDIFLGAF